MFFSENKNNRDFHSDKPWITIAPNKRYFMFEDGKSFFSLVPPWPDNRRRPITSAFDIKKTNFLYVDLTMDPNGWKTSLI